jgi:hypothetical protein
MYTIRFSIPFIRAVDAWIGPPPDLNDLQGFILEVRRFSNVEKSAGWQNVSGTPPSRPRRFGETGCT